MSSNLSPSDKFYGPKLKIERAKHHINDLNRQIGEFAKRQPYVVRIEPMIPRTIIKTKAHPKGCDLVVRIKEPIPPCIVLTIGDAIHNLRSALDLLACDLVRPFTNGDTTHVWFPFGENANDFEGRINNGKINRTGPQIMNVMRSFKAYPGGNNPLYALHRLDITDKHLEMLETSSSGLLPPVHGPHLHIFNNIIIGLQDGTRYVAGLPIPDKRKLYDEIPMMFQIHFAQGLPLEHQPVIPTLLQITKLVEDIIAKFEAIP